MHLDLVHEPTVFDKPSRDWERHWFDAVDSLQGQISDGVVRDTVWCQLTYNYFILIKYSLCVYVCMYSIR